MRRSLAALALCGLLAGVRRSLPVPRLGAGAALDRACGGRLSQPERAPGRDVPRRPARDEQARAVRARRHRLRQDRRHPGRVAARRQRPSAPLPILREERSRRAAPCCARSSPAWSSTCRSIPTPTPTRWIIACGSRSSSSTRSPIRPRWPGATGRRPATRRSSRRTSRACSTASWRRWNASKTIRATRATRTRSSPTSAAAAPVGYTGMIWTGFRPSDDACDYNFLIPSEMFAVVALGDMAEIERDVYHNVVKAREAKALRDEVQRGIQTYGLVLVPKYGYIYAYEVDGLGHAILTDDANIPSLLSAPYIGYTAPATATTRTRAASCCRRTTRRSIKDTSGARHRQLSHARPLGVAARADRAGLTATSQLREARRARRSCSPATRAITCLHESFNPDDPHSSPAAGLRLAQRAVFRVRDDAVPRRREIPMGDTERPRVLEQSAFARTVAGPARMPTKEAMSKARSSSEFSGATKAKGRSSISIAAGLRRGGAIRRRRQRRPFDRRRRHRARAAHRSVGRAQSACRVVRRRRDGRQSADAARRTRRAWRRIGIERRAREDLRPRAPRVAVSRRCATRRREAHAARTRSERRGAESGPPTSIKSRAPASGLAISPTRRARADSPDLARRGRRSNGGRRRRLAARRGELRPHVVDGVGTCTIEARARQARADGGRARVAARRRLRHLSVRDQLAHDRRRRVHRARHRSDRDRSTSSASSRRTARASAPDRCRRSCTTSAASIFGAKAASSAR